MFLFQMAKPLIICICLFIRIYTIVPLNLLMSSIDYWKYGIRTLIEILRMIFDKVVSFLSYNFTL